MSSVPMWTAMYRYPRDGGTFAQRLLMSDEFWKRPSWNWSTKTAAVEDEAERIAKRRRLTQAQFLMLCETLHRTYGLGVGIHDMYFDHQWRIVGLHGTDNADHLVHIDFGRSINEPLIDLMGANRHDTTFPLSVIVDPMLTSLIMLYYAKETIKCASPKQSQSLLKHSPRSWLERSMAT
jgi:hypothetical protein